jgi:outer membrane receptor protein involved in Fe transport
VQVIPKYVRLFAEAKGDVNKSSLKDFSETNPFLGQNISIKNSVDQLDLAAGLKGTLAPGLGFKATFFRNDVKNMPLFVSNFNFPVGYNRFKVIYDGGRATVTGFNGELDFKASEDLDIFGRVEFKDYKMATEAQPWNLPKFKLSAGTNIHISNKVNLTGTLLFRGDTKDITPDLASSTAGATKIVSLKAFADINAGAEYKVNSRFGIFVQANNLLNATYSSWLYYPNYGFNIFGGVSYGF